MTLLSGVSRLHFVCSQKDHRSISRLNSLTCFSPCHQEALREKTDELLTAQQTSQEATACAQRLESQLELLRPAEPNLAAKLMADSALNVDPHLDVAEQFDNSSVASNESNELSTEESATALQQTDPAFPTASEGSPSNHTNAQQALERQITQFWPQLTQDWRLQDRTQKTRDQQDLMTGQELESMHQPVKEWARQASGSTQLSTSPDLMLEEAELQVIELPSELTRASDSVIQGSQLSGNVLAAQKDDGPVEVHAGVGSTNPDSVRESTRIKFLESEVAELQDRLEDATAVIEQLSAEALQNESTIRQLQQDLGSSEDMVWNAERVISESRFREDVLTSQCEELAAVVPEVEALVLELLEDDAQLESALSNIVEVHFEDQQAWTHSQENFVCLEEEVESLRSDIREGKHLKSKLGQQLDLERQKNSAVQRRVEESEQSKRGLQDELDRVTSDWIVQTQQSDDLKQRLSSLEASNSELSCEIGVLKQQASNQVQLVEDAKRTEVALTHQVQDLGKQVTSEKSENGALASELMALLQLAEEREAQTQTLSQTLHSRQEELEVLSRSLTDAQVENQALKESVNALTPLQSQSAVPFSGTGQADDAKIQRELELAQAEALQLRGVIQARDDDSASLQQTLEREKSQAADLSTQLRATQNELLDLRQELEISEEHIQSLDAELTEAKQAAHEIAESRRLEQQLNGTCNAQVKFQTY